MRGPYMIVFNLPEESERWSQHAQDLIDARKMVTYLEDEENEEHNTLGDKIVDVTRLGRKSEGKCRPLRVQFVGQMYRDIAVKLSFRIKYMFENEVLRKAVMVKDLCREDRETAKRKYEQRKQQRAAVQNQNISTVPVVETQVTPANLVDDRQGASEENVTPPPRETQPRVP